MQIGSGQFLQGDCLELMRNIPDGSVDMVLCDLPYGTTQIKWDAVIPFDLMWEQYWRVCRPNAAVVLTAAQPFTSALVMSQPSRLRDEWIWHKNTGSNFANASRQPLREHESVLVFSKGATTYNPIKRPRHSAASVKANEKPIHGSTTKGEHGLGTKRQLKKYDQYERNPGTVLAFDSVPNSGGGKLHPTQKPVALFEYLIRTYTNEGEHVLDNTAGSGTTAIAAENAGRRWTCMERDPTYYEAAIARVWDHITCS